MSQTRVYVYITYQAYYMYMYMYVFIAMGPRARKLMIHGHVSSLLWSVQVIVVEVHTLYMYN